MFQSQVLPKTSAAAVFSDSLHNNNMVLSDIPVLLFESHRFRLRNKHEVCGIDVLIPAEGGPGDFSTPQKQFILWTRPFISITEGHGPEKNSVNLDQWEYDYVFQNILPHYTYRPIHNIEPFIAESPLISVSMDKDNLTITHRRDGMDMRVSFFAWDALDLVRNYLRLDDAMKINGKNEMEYKQLIPALHYRWLMSQVPRVTNVFRKDCDKEMAGKDSAIGFATEPELEPADLMPGSEFMTFMTESLALVGFDVTLLATAMEKYGHKKLDKKAGPPEYMLEDWREIGFMFFYRTKKVIDVMALPFEKVSK
jgi:hypothetical protein